MPNLQSVFRTPESRKYLTIMFVDITNSTQMKVEETEAQWLTTYGWFFDQLETLVKEQGGEIVKYLGDGVMARFEELSAQAAINAAIRINEAIADSNQQQRVRLTCSVGIASGYVLEFETPYGQHDCIGLVVDRASRLCSAANAMAIFVDTETIAAAAMRQVQSRLGLAIVPRRSMQEYQGDVQRIELKGMSKPVEYYEVLWSQYRYGIKSEYQTQQVEKKNVSKPEELFEANDTSTVEADRRYRGVIEENHPNRGFGIIKRDGDGEKIFFHYSQVVGELQPNKSDSVHFIAVTTAKRVEAHSVIILENRLIGHLEWFNQEKGYGFVSIRDADGRKVNLYVSKMECCKGLTPHTHVSFTVGENAKGLTAKKLEEADTHGITVKQHHLDIGAQETGNIIDYLTAKGFGFIECKGNNIFFHHSDLHDQHTALHTGDLVAFEVTTGKEPGKYAAKKIMVVGGESSD